jgi:death-on-curing protein
VSVSPRFLELESILALHAEQLAMFGGADGLRDLGALESAIAQPSATFDGQYLHEDLHAMAAAYLFHVVQNHPFVDGNKRVGFIAAMTFLEANGVNTEPLPELYELTMGVASGKVSKAQIAAALRRLFPG